MMKKNHSIFIGIIFILLTTTSYAATIDIKPENISIDDILIGGYTKSIISITTDSKEGFILSPSANGSIKDWITFNPKQNLEVSATSPLVLEIIISPPKTAAEKLYYSNIILNLKKKIPTLFMNKKVKTLNMVISTTNKEIKNINVENLVAYNAEKGSLIDIAANFTNIGNMPAEVNINIYHDGKLSPNVIKLESKQNVEYIINLATDDMKQGMNDIKVEVVSQGNVLHSKKFLIDIKEKGSLSSDLKILSIKAPKIAFEGEVVKFIPIFENIGESSVYATFRGDIMKNSDKIATISSDEIYSPIGRIRSTEVSFIPDKRGKYVIDSSIYYKDIKTDNVEMILQVIPKSKKFQPLRFTLYPMLIVIFIMTVILITKSLLKRKSK